MSSSRSDLDTPLNKDPLVGAELSLSDMILLIVDDSPVNLSLMSGIFRDRHKIKVANGGEKALRLAQSEPRPDLVLLDVVMPDVDGYEVCRRLKQDPATRDIPIIFLTGLVDPEEEKKGLELGAADFVTKPVNPPVIVARVSNQLTIKALRDRDRRNLEIIAREKQLLELEQAKTEKLMLNILPAPIADRLKKGEQNISGDHTDVSVLFADIVEFTRMSTQVSAAELVRLLNDLFSRFDMRAREIGLEKIKTIGDAYMVVGGLPTALENHTELCAEMAFGMLEDLQAFNELYGANFRLRIGINSGPVVAGVIGFTKFAYDLWGLTVNAASRMESTAPAGRIQVSEDTAKLLEGKYLLESGGVVECKGLGELSTRLLIGRRANS